MENSPKLLSICIPTYNRAKILESSLNSLLSNPDFNNEEIEIVISDNCSTDNTKEIMLNFPNIKYYRNDTNESFYNLTTVLNHATGKYLKLFNDTFCFKPGALKHLIDRIKLHQDDFKNLFFYPNFLHNHNIVKEINSIDAFFLECSYNTTWTASIGFWKKDFDCLSNKNRYAVQHFPQLEWMYRTVNNGKPTIIYFEDLFEITIPNKKGGYNVFKTFVEDYLNIVIREKLSFNVYEKEKYRLCKNFVYPWLITMFVKDNDNFTFETSGVFKILFKKYWYEPYFYPMLLAFWVKKIKG